jgi:sugar transferase (PEP-CTERM/EpsH1 system associated)
MQILWLKSDLLLPLDKGGKLRTWHLMRHLAKRHEITYLGFADVEEIRRGSVPAIVDRMKEVAVRVETVPRSDVHKGSARFYADAMLHLVDPLPYAVGKYRSRAFRRRVSELLDEQRFDLVVCDFLFPAVNLPHPLLCPAVIFTHNVEAEIWRRHAETRAGGLSGLLYRTQYKRMLRYEGRTLTRFDGVLAVSDRDRDTFTRVYPGAVRGAISVVPTGVDTEFFAPAPSPEKGRRLVFTGSMDWLPNEDAMTYFCREILPRIRADIPDVSLDIVGRAPTAAVQKLAADHGITVTGRVEDVRPFMRDAAVYVVPLRIAGGTRLKIFEAMAMAKAVVSTSVGAEGLPLEHGRHLMLADEPQAFARSVVRLLRDVGRRREIEQAARALVVERFDWSVAAAEMESALERVVQTTRAYAPGPSFSSGVASKFQGGTTSRPVGAPTPTIQTETGVL